MRRPGRPRTVEEVRQLVIRMAQENRLWGYTRISSALQNLGYQISRTTVRSVLQAAGLEPAPQRRTQTTWKEFLKTHWASLAACDFFNVEVWTLFGLVRYDVLFVIRLATREVHIAGITPSANGSWMQQVARNVTDPFTGFLRNCRFLIHDRSSLFHEGFKAVLQSAGVDTIGLPPRSPNLNAYAERFVRTIKEECLNQMIPLGEDSLRNAVAQFVDHYHRERNHQGLHRPRNHNLAADASGNYRLLDRGEDFEFELVGLGAVNPPGGHPLPVLARTVFVDFHKSQLATPRTLERRSRPVKRLAGWPSRISPTTQLARTHARN